MSEKLKPCPFCGGWSLFKEHRVLHVPILIEKNLHNNYRIICLDCDAYGPLKGDSLELAIELWNTRSAPQKREVEVEDE